MFDDVQGQIYVQIGPIKMIGGWLNDIENMFYQSVFKPGKIVVGQK
jgi:hypothetical protein